MALKKLVWDTSAIINIKEPNGDGYSPGHSLMKDLSDGWISGPYRNIFPTLAVFEGSAAVSRKHRQGHMMLREFYLLDENAMLYDMDEALIRNVYELFARPGFDQLRGADLVFACIAFIEGAILVTLDGGFEKHVGREIDVLDLSHSLNDPKYRKRFNMS